MKYIRNAAVILLLFGAAAYIGDFWKDAPSTIKTSPGLSSGYKGFLRTTAKSVVVATTRENLDRLVQLGVAGDDTGITRMVIEGNAFLTDDLTSCLVITGGSVQCEVRIESGAQQGRSGWVPREFIR